MTDSRAADLIAAACARWRLTLGAFRTETFTSIVQQVAGPHGPAALKVLKPAGREERAAIPILGWFDGHGAVRLLDHHGDAQLLEWLPGPPLSDLVSQGRDDQATAALAATAKSLHAARPTPPPTGLHDLADRFAPLLARGDAVARTAAALLASGPPPRPLHGDLHHGNVLADAAGTWRAIDPKGVFGDPHYDLANTFCNPVDQPAVARDANRVLAMATTFATTMNLDRERLLAFAFCHIHLATIWSIQDGQDPTHGHAMTAIIGPLVSP